MGCLINKLKPLYIPTGPFEQWDMAKNRWALAAIGLLFCEFASTLLAAFHPVASAVGRYTIDVWDDGLPQNSVIAMTQTRDGYLWLGTLGGLVRFDGIRFTVFDESNTPGLKSSRIVSLFEDSRSNLWVGTETAGVALVKDGQITSLRLGQGTREGRLAAACEDASGAVWLYTMDGQLWRYQNGTTNLFLAGAGQSSRCRALVAEPSGLLWIGTDRRLSAFDPTQARNPPALQFRQDRPLDKLDFLLASRLGGFWRLAEGRIQKWTANGRASDLGPYPWNRVPVTAACEDQQGNLLVGTRGDGVFWFDADGKFTRLSTDQGLSYNYIHSLHADREGNVWVGTDGGGLNRVKRQVFGVLEPTRGLVVQSVCADHQGGLWLGYNGGGVDYWKEGALQRYDPGLGLFNLPVRAVFVDRNQRFLVGTWGAGLFQLQDGKFQRPAGAETINPVVLAIHQDRRGRLWLGTQGGLACEENGDWKVFGTRDGLSADEVWAIADDLEGNLWIGTREGGLNRLHNGQFNSFHKQDGLPGEDISSLYVDHEGVLWVGTFGSGLGRLSGGRWTRYTTRDGLISNSIGHLIEDGHGYLWIGSYKGIMRVEKRALNNFALGQTNFVACRAYAKPDGLPMSECTQGSQPGSTRTPDGKLWFATIRGLVSVDPSQLSQNPNTNPPPVKIESVLIDGTEKNTASLRGYLPSTIIVPAGDERLEIQYTSLNLAAPDRARFKYRLEGHETAWTEAGNIRVARYSKLPPGQYRFQVTAGNEDGVWNETGASLAFVVQPPIWRTWWFLTGTAAGLLGTVVGAVHYFSTQKLQRQVERLRQQEALEKERARIARDIHDQLGASLTQVALLGELVESDKDSPADVEGHARQISQTARDTTRVLDEIVWTVNPSNDTLDGLITYVCKYAQEYLAVAGLRYRLEVPPQLPATPISPEVRHNIFLAAKEAVTNVVRHARASSVRLRLCLEPSAFILEIQDDGHGPGGLNEPAAQARNGLRNMRKRMDDIGGIFSIIAAPDGGSLVRLTAPLGSGRIDAPGEAAQDRTPARTQD